MKDDYFGAEGGEDEVTAKVFLIDYGVVLNNLASKTCIRELPRMLKHATKPLAMMVSLAGLRPLEVTISYEKGMNQLGQTVAQDWNVYSKVLCF